MKPLIVLFFSLFILRVSAQNNNSTIVNTQKPFQQGDSVYQAADFPGGVNEWVKFIERNLHTETPASNKAPAGIYTVAASFTIDSAGKVIEIKILKDPGYGTAEDVKKLLSRSPKWLPASINSKPCVYHEKQNFNYEVIER